jgi:O-antigen/teichoic acid export membrane protein
MLNNFLSSIFFRIDVMLLKALHGPAGDLVNGWYSTAYRFIDGLNIIPSFFTLAIFPIMARYAESAPDSLLRSYILSIKFLLIVSLPITVGTVVLADQIIFLFFTQDFANSVIALRLLILFLPFSYINSVTQYVLIALNQQRFLTLAFAVGALFNIAANLLLIPYYSFVGAAITTVLSELVLMAPFFYAVHKHLGSVPLLSLSLRPAVAAGIMGLVVWRLHGHNLLLVVPVGALVYFLGLLALRTFDAQDVAVLKGLKAR